MLVGTFFNPITLHEAISCRIDRLRTHTKRPSPTHDHFSPDILTRYMQALHALPSPSCFVRVLSSIRCLSRFLSQCVPSVCQALYVCSPFPLGLQPQHGTTRVNNFSLHQCPPNPNRPRHSASLPLFYFSTSVFLSRDKRRCFRVSFAVFNSCMAFTRIAVSCEYLTPSISPS